jgi:hypothetical protein
MARASVLSIAGLIALGLGCSDPVEPDDPALLPGPTPAAVIGAFSGEAEDPTGVVTYLGLAIEHVGVPGEDGTFAIAGIFGLGFSATTVGGQGAIVGTITGRRLDLTLTTTEVGCGVMTASGTIDESASELVLPLQSETGTCYEAGAVMTLRRCAALDPEWPSTCDPAPARQSSTDP